MINAKHTITLIAVAALAFVAGRSTLISESAALADAQQPPAKDKGKAADPARTTAPPKAVSDDAVDVHQQQDPKVQAMEMAGQPGEHHKVLDAAVGEFDAVVHIAMSPGTPMVESKGTVKREWALDGHYMRETVDADFMGAPFHGLGYMGYNNLDGQYEFAWMDSMNTSIMMAAGTYNTEKKILTTRGTHRDPATGHVVTGWGTWDLSNPNRQVVAEYTIDENGKEYKSFDGVFERKTTKK